MEGEDLKSYNSGDVGKMRIPKIYSSFLRDYSRFKFCDRFCVQAQKMETQRRAKPDFMQFDAETSPSEKNSSLPKVFASTGYRKGVFIVTGGLNEKSW